MKNRIRFFLCLLLILALGSGMGLSAAADDYYYLSTAETYYDMQVYQFYRDITDSNFSQAMGEFAPGLIYEYDNIFLYISGRPTTPGTYTLRGRASTADGNGEEYSVTIVVEAPRDPGTGEILDVPVQQPLLAPVLTKSPTDESVYQGSSAMFIARADSADRIEWYLVEPGSYSTYSLQDASSILKGLSYSGQGTEVLELYNIPLEMDGWKVECLFTNAYGNVMSEAATVKVEELKLVSPTINSQPQGGQKDMDSSILLSVVANNNTEGSSLKYQWYMSATGNGNLNPISGANSSSYTPAKTEGTVYYTVAVWSSIDGKDSGKTYSNPAAVTYSKTPAVVNPTASPVPSTVPTVMPVITPSPTVSTDAQKDSGGIGTLAVLVVVLILSAALAAVILLILRKNAKTAAPASDTVPFMDMLMDERKAPKAPVKDEPVLEPVQPKARPVQRDWLCSCGALNNSPFCTQCGRAKPVIKPCSKCGWMPESANQIPRFCPQCGTAFEE